MFARPDGLTFGILHSRFHEIWSLRMGTSLEDRPRYTPSTCFETFPFPEGMTPDVPFYMNALNEKAQAIADVAEQLNACRLRWLNPEEMVEQVPEIVSGYPDRIVPRDARAEKELQKRTLTNLYNERPQWLDELHKKLDAAVADAYGWPINLSDDEVIAKLFALNQERAKKAERQ